MQLANKTVFFAVLSSVNWNLMNYTDMPRLILQATIYVLFG